MVLFIGVYKGGDKMENNNAIEVRKMYKYFKLQYDKPSTLKERIVFWNREKPEYHEVLENINLDIKKGETVALIGTNGSGKSTLLKLMTKILYPNKGTVKTFGKLTSLLELGAGFHPDFTGRENIYFNASVFGLTKKLIDKRLQQIIDFSELGEFIDNPVRTYSSGMYMRLAFSVAINVDADILLIDEILSVGDQHFQDKCFEKLNQLKKSDTTIVIVSHSLDVISKLCDRVVWIYNGEFKLDGDPTYVIDEYIKQIKEDNKDKFKKKEYKEKDTYKGTIFIDTPKAFADIPESQEVFIVGGWELNDCMHSQLIVYFDGIETQNVSRTDRPDVIMTYEEHYGGILTNKQPGFNVPISIKGISKGEHIVKIETIDNRGKTISEKEVKVNIV